MQALVLWWAWMSDVYLLLLKYHVYIEVRIKFLYKPKSKYELQAYRKDGLSPLLRVSARLCRPQGVHTPDLKLVKI
jgi:hypothetical protein